MSFTSSNVQVPRVVFPPKTINFSPHAVIECEQRGTTSQIKNYEAVKYILLDFKLVIRYAFSCLSKGNKKEFGSETNLQELLHSTPIVGSAPRE